MKKSNIALALGIALLVSLPGMSAAQSYKWRDQNGSIVYSDKPPPANIPPGNILQKPKLTQAAPPAPAPGKAAEGKASGPQSIAEREAEFKKRQAADAKKAKADSEKSAQEEQRLANCKSLRENLATLESGQRIARTDDKGERYFISDDDRAKDIAKMRDQMASAKC